MSGERDSGAELQQRVETLEAALRDMALLANDAIQRQETLQALLRGAVRTANESEAEKRRMRRSMQRKDKVMRKLRKNVDSLQKALDNM